MLNLPAQHERTLEERLAVLEDKTRPQPKRIIDYVKEWAGVATALIALLYTIPLGVWDRFVVTSEQQKERRVDQLRSAVVQLAELDSSMARGYNAISDATIRMFFVRAMSSQKSAILSRVEPLIENHHVDLSVAESLLLAYNVAQTGNVALARALYDSTLQKAQQGATDFMLADVYRMRGQLYSVLPAGPDIRGIRDNYTQTVRILLRSNSPAMFMQLAYSGFEWSLHERAFGDWLCGEQLSQWAEHLLTRLPFASPDVATMIGTYQAQAGAQARRTNQPAGGCDPAYTPWLLNVSQ